MIPDAFETLTELRARGFMVAVHNDYRTNTSAGDNQVWTFWLLTHANGRFFKGEGPSDAEALWDIRVKVDAAGYA